jgi:hypothetical protein
MPSKIINEAMIFPLKLATLVASLRFFENHQIVARKSLPPSRGKPGKRLNKPKIRFILEIIKNKAETEGIVIK